MSASHWTTVAAYVSLFSTRNHATRFAATDFTSCLSRNCNSDYPMIDKPLPAPSISVVSSDFCGQSLQSSNTTSSTAVVMIIFAATTYVFLDLNRIPIIHTKGYNVECQMKLSYQTISIEIVF